MNEELTLAYFKKLETWVSLMATILTAYETGKYLVQYNPFNSPAYVYWIDVLIMSVPIYGIIYAFIKLPMAIGEFISKNKFFDD